MPALPDGDALTVSDELAAREPVLAALAAASVLGLPAPLSVTDLGFSLPAATAEVSNTRLGQSNH